jgi:O-antigen/teichoic acid export membrane protein
LNISLALFSASQEPGQPQAVARLGTIIRQAFPLGVSMFLLTLFTRLGVVVVGYLGDSASVAIYGTAFTLAASSGFIATSITMAYFPRLARAVQDANQQVTVSIVKRQISMITLAYGTLCALGIIFSPLAVHLLYGKKFVASGLVMILLMPVLYISCINMALKFTLNAMQYNWMDAFSVAAGIVTFFIGFGVITVLPRPQTLALAWGLGELMIFGCKTITCKYINLPAGTSIYLILITLSLLSAAAGLRWFYFPKF